MDKYIKLYKIGNFYNGYGDNGVILHYLMGYKFMEARNCCAFSDSAYNKVRSIIQIKKISYVIYWKDKIIDKYKGINKMYEQVLEKALERMRIEQVIREYKCNNRDYKIEDLIDVIKIDSK